MPTAAITKRIVDGVEPTEREQLIWDPELRGFGLRVTPAGSKSYLLQYRLGGRGAKTRRYTIGQHGSPWSPASARAEAERLLIQVRQGVDIVEAKKQREREARDLAFQPYVRRFVDSYLKENWSASWADAEASLLRNAVPVLKDKPLPKITRSDLKGLLDRHKTKAATRRNLYAVLRRLFRWAVSEGDLERSPLEGVEAPPLPEKRDRVLTDDELRSVYVASRGLGHPFGPLVRLLILTGQRVEEIGRASWAEFDRARRVWSIPKERAKNRRATDVPLSEPVLAELDQLAKTKEWPRKGLLFTTNGKTPVSGYSRAKSRLDAIVQKAREDNGDPELPAWRLHDLRRTLATGLQRLGVRFEVTEAILNHVSGARSGVAGVYQRHEWTEEKKAALSAWATSVLALVEAQPDVSNVVPLRPV